MDEDLQDQRIFDALQMKFNGGKDRPDTGSDWVLSLGRYFLGTPYAAGTLDKGGPETLIVNLREFDCFTFVENVVALARVLSSGPGSFERYRETLMSLRYRRGRPEGYASRLHYFSDWLFENQRRGMIKNMSRMPGAQKLAKKIDLMTRHPADYPALKDHNTYRQMQLVERRLSDRAIYYIPRTSMKEAAVRIADGDLIAVTARAEGLDVAHVGIAVRVKRQLHLLHASSRAGRVILSPETLNRYLAESGNRTGIMVARAAETALFS